jgi:hypothetical protein
MLNRVANAGWTAWWNLTDQERKRIERSLWHIIVMYTNDPERLWAFLQRAIELNTARSLAVAAVLIEIAGHRMQHEGFRAALHVAKVHPFEALYDRYLASRPTR